MAERLNLFVYGSLRERDVQRAIFGRPVAGTPDALTGYALSSLPAGHLIVDESEDAGDRVPGLRLAISEAELAAADAYEIEDYARIAVRLESGAEAFVYARA